MSFENSDQQEIYFEFLFENIISLYFSYYSQKKIVLAMSGGLDSSCILIASKIKGKIFDELYHVPYNNKNDFDLILSKEISRIIGYKLKVTQERKINLSYLKKRSSAGTAMILGPQYLKFNHIDYQWGEDEKIIQISGQNADTLYTIDNFNPGSSIIGLKRFISMIRTITYRITYSAIFLSNNKINKFISDLIIKYNFKSNIKNNFYNYLLSTINSPLEHVVPLKNNNLKGAINDDYEIYKKKTILKPIIKIFSKINGNDIENYTINKKNKLVRFFRLVRTVNNVSINYNNLDSFEDILTLLPFQEGPLSFYFQNYILKPRDTFEIKRLFKKYFYKFFNKTHYSISKKAVQSSKMHNIELSKKIKSFIVKIFGWKFINYFSKIILNRKFNIEIKYKFQNEFDALTKMTNLNERFILNFLDNENFKLYFEKLYSEMLAKDDLGKYSRNKLMEFSRLINMDIYLRKIFDVR